MTAPTPKLPPGMQIGPQGAKPGAKPAGKKPAGKNMDMNEYDLRKMDLTRKYDDDFSPADGISFRDHALLVMVAVVVGFFLLWANIATLDEVSRGDGTVVPSSEVKAVQNLEGGIIDEFLVREGDVVKAGQVLLRMRNIQARADFEATMQKYLGIQAALDRLKAEAEGKETATFSEDVRRGSSESLRAEQNAFDANRKQLENQAIVLRDQLTQKEQEVAELQRRIADTGSMLSLAVDEKNLIEPMVAKGAANKKELLQVRQRIASQSAELNGLRLALPRSQSAVKEVKSRLETLTTDFRAQARKELAERTIEFNIIKQTLAAYRDKSERTEIKSTDNGTVKDLKITTVGGVARPGETIMEIVPLDDKLVVEARILPRDIAFVHVGHKAIVRLTAFDFSVYGSLEGRVVEVSPDSIMNDKGESFYRVRVQTDKTSVNKGDKELKIMPGMQATVDIVTGEKTVMNYLLKPFTKAAQTALRER